MKTKDMRALKSYFLTHCLCWFLLLANYGISYAQQLKIGVFDEHDLYLKTSKPYQVGWQVLTKAASQAGIEIVPVEDAWARLMMDVKQQKIDGIFGAMQTSERLAWANFSSPLSSDLIHIFTYPEAKVERVDEVDKMRAAVGVSKNSIQHQMAIDMGFENIYAILDRNVLYKMLTAKRIDFLIFSDSFINLYCYKYTQSKAPNCLKPLVPALADNSMHVMFSKSQQHLKPIYLLLNEAISSQHQSGEIRKIYSTYYNDEKAYQTWLKSWENFQLTYD